MTSCQEPAVECPDGWTLFPHTGLCYKYQAARRSWAEARRHCRTSAAAGADLASVPDKERGHQDIFSYQ